MNDTPPDNSSKTKTYLNGVEAPDQSKQIVGLLSGETFTRPDVDSGYPVAKLIDKSGVEVENFPRCDGFPDTRSHRLKLGAQLYSHGALTFYSSPVPSSLVSCMWWRHLLRRRPPNVRVRSRFVAFNHSSAPLSEQVVVLVHQAPGVAKPINLLDYLGEDVRKSMSIGIVVKDIIAPVTASGNMIETVGKFEVNEARHGQGRMG
jgi:hypothetical protein